MKHLIFTFVLAFCCTFAVSAQSEYKSAIGLRFGYPASITFKQFLNEKNAIEVYAGFRRWGNYLSYTNVGALYQIHAPIKGVEGLQWYVGGGASAFIWKYDDTYNFGGDFNNFNLGVSGCLGLDYKFAEYPINLSVDWVPTFVIGDAYYGGFRGDAGALSARYTFR
ncbi:MAG: hypothetical protein IT269_02305 [Saprospiraceae bacterium]|nr:hypothetical protein [Saprospiraceae bacterium]